MTLLYTLARKRSILLILLAVCKRARCAGLKFKLRKRLSARKEVKFLGHVVTRNGKEVDANKLERVGEAKVPGWKKEIKSFLCSAHFTDALRNAMET